MQFVCRLGTPEGRIVEEIHHASDEATLRQQLERRGFHLFEVRRKGLPLSFGLPSLRRGKVISTRDFLIFNQELASLLKAGLPLLQALELMLERMAESRFKTVLADVRDRVKSGEELSDAFAEYGEHFPRLYPAALKAGEKSGELEEVLRRFVRYLKLVTEARRRVVSALVYPAVIISLSVIMITVLSIWVVPKFQDFFAELEVELPLITRILLGTSRFLVDHLTWIILGLALAIAILWRWAGSARGSVTLDYWRLKIPLLGSVFQRFSLSEFCRSLATLLSGGIPLVTAFEIASGAVSNGYVRQQLEPRIQVVREGGAFYEALEQSGVFVPMAIDMVKVGEATGALDEMLVAVSDFLDEQLETRMQRVLSVVEPLMLVFLGLVIAILLISIYLPLFSSLSQSKF